MSDNNEFDINLEGLVTQEGEQVNSSSGANLPAPKASSEGTQTPATQSAPTPQAPRPATPTGLATARVQAQLAQQQQKQQEALARKKQLVDNGFDVPIELEIEIASHATKNEFLQMGLEDAVRRDTVGQVPTVAKQLLAELPPNVAKVTEGHLRTVLESLAANTPEAFNDPSTLQSAVNLAVGMAVKEQMAGKLKTAAPAAQAGVAAIPQTQGQAKATGVPEKFKGQISAKSWDAVANVDPDEPLSLFD